jgi:hypothetical protein
MLSFLSCWNQGALFVSVSACHRFRRSVFERSLCVDQGVQERVSDKAWSTLPVDYMINSAWHFMHSLGAMCLSV